MIQTYGPVGLVIVMILQTIIAPISSEVVLMFAGVIGMNLLDIVLFGGIGLLIGAIIAFYIGRLGGKPIIIKLIGDKWLNRLDKWVEKNGMIAIFITRLVPVIPFDLISYLSGITKIKFKYYFSATFLGAFPRTFLLAIVGASIGEILKLLGIGLELTLMIGILGFIFLAYLDRKGYLSMIYSFILNKLIRRRIRTNK
jgi:uncharacterized membrane protein YdjX (TVP38/TMEM64 family)